LTVFHEVPEKVKRKHTAPKLNRKAKLWSWSTSRMNSSGD
jgi:hypothetical protein